MTSISPPLSAAHVARYYQEEYANSASAYYSEGQTVHGRWHGRLAAELGLVGAVDQEKFFRLALGQNPEDGSVWIRHRDTAKTRDGKEVAHRAAWDFTLSAPKSVSCTALPGGDEGVREAHRRAVQVAMDRLEQYTQARMGGDRLSYTTGKWIAAMFEHDTARPVNGYPAAQLHTHVVVFNMTEGPDGQARSLQSSELFRVKSMVTAVYQAELARNLLDLGYQLRRGAAHAPEIKGYTREYLNAESPRRAQILQQLEALGLEGGRAAQIVALQSRSGKLSLTPEEVRQLHLAQAAVYDNQPRQVVEQRASKQAEPRRQVSAEEAVGWAIRKLTRMEGVIEQYQIVREALHRGQGSLRTPGVEQEIQRRCTVTADMARQPDLIPVHHYRDYAPGERYTTPQLLAMEHEALRLVAGWEKGQHAPIAPELTKEQIRGAQSAEGFALNDSQKWAVWNAVTSKDRVTGIQGGAGVGKSTSLWLVHQLAQQEGYDVVGLAATSGATKQLQKAGIPSKTVQRQLIEKLEPEATRRLYVLDEASLVSDQMVSQLARSLRPEDRLLLVGDTRQHQSIEAGRIFEAMQQAGMETRGMSKIVRQRNPEALAVVQQFAQGNVPGALSLLKDQDRIHEIPHRRKRFAAIAAAYAEAPDRTLVVSPDNLSREQINAAIRQWLRGSQLSEDRYTVQILVGRQQITPEDKYLAATYEEGNVVRFGRRNEALGVEKGQYALVIDRDTDLNSITVKERGGRNRVFDIDLATLSSLELYQTEQRGFAQGDRIQFTSAWREKGLANRDRGVIEELDKRGNVTVRMEETGRKVQWNLEEMPHLDYGYTMTSYSAQGLSVDRVLLHIDTGDSRVRRLIDKTLAYVGASRARDEIRIYTDRAEDLEATLSRLALKPKAMSREEIAEYSQSVPSIAINKREERAQEMAAAMEL